MKAVVWCHPNLQIKGTLDYTSPGELAAKYDEELYQGYFDNQALFHFRLCPYDSVSHTCQQLQPRQNHHAVQRQIESNPIKSIKRFHQNHKERVPLIRKNKKSTFYPQPWKGIFWFIDWEKSPYKSESLDLGNKCILAKCSSKTRQMCITVQRYDEALKTVARKHQLQLIPCRMSDHPQEHLYSYHAVLKQPATRGTNVIFFSSLSKGNQTWQDEASYSQFHLH